MLQALGEGVADEAKVIALAKLEGARRGGDGSEWQDGGDQEKREAATGHVLGGRREKGGSAAGSGRGRKRQKRDERNGIGR
jgi:hypothetical protein